MRNFAINNIYLYDRIAKIKKIPFSTKEFLILCPPCINTEGCFQKFEWLFFYLKG